MNSTQLKKHTPGPWSYRSNEWSRIEIHYPGGQLASVSKWDDPSSPPPVPEMHANAALIAAAPDLLEALKDMVSLFSGYQGMQLERAKLAIEKAESQAIR